MTQDLNRLSDQYAKEIDAYVEDAIGEPTEAEVDAAERTLEQGEGLPGIAALQQLAAERRG